MYIKQGQILQIREAVEEIKKLTTLETCGLDNETKEKMKLWVMWFDVYANQIECALNGELDERFR
ncbi:hypothetical protein [Lacrimispora sp.]|uniref:hypothetical protein n=1 Tax=Lacrimispora sp. TaxID=2719234 RepID=UPI0028AAAF18|nr:hypothetical protein [Lacrimispora sp.]